MRTFNIFLAGKSDIEHSLADCVKGDAFMPICIPYDLPAYKTLANENIFVMNGERAEHQDIRPLRIIILNLMPKKIETETQILRLLSNSPLHVNIKLLHVASHISKNTPPNHLSNFYTTFEDVQNDRYDGMIITGAPVEQMEFEDVDYWDELCSIMEWSKTHVYSCIHICWGAFAGLYYHFGIKKHPLKKKMSGVFPHRVVSEKSPILRGFDDVFYAPHSRYTEVCEKDIENEGMLQVLTYSEKAGIHIVANKNGRQFFITGHFEYDRETLAEEYTRDKEKGIDIDIPYNYFPDDDINKKPEFSWRCHANLMFGNWLNYCVYQETPYDLSELDIFNWEWEV